MIAKKRKWWDYDLSESTSPASLGCGIPCIAFVVFLVVAVVFVSIVGN